MVLKLNRWVRTILTYTPYDIVENISPQCFITVRLCQYFDSDHSSVHKGGTDAVDTHSIRSQTFVHAPCETHHSMLSGAVDRSRWDCRHYSYMSDTPHSLRHTMYHHCIKNYSCACVCVCVREREVTGKHSAATKLNRTFLWKAPAGRYIKESTDTASKGAIALG